MVSVRYYFKKPRIDEDRYDLFGKTVAMRFRDMENRQRLFAEKMINDILFDAEMGTLNTPSHYHNTVYMGRSRTSSSSLSTTSPIS